MAAARTARGIDSPSFDTVKDLLFDQYESVRYDPESGLPPEALEAKVREFLEENAALPRVLQRAEVFSIITRGARIAMEPYDWFPMKLEHGGLLREMTRRWMREAEAGPIADAAGLSRDLYRSGCARAGLDTGHISPGWERMFEYGLDGLAEEARELREALPDRDPREAFYRAVEIVYEAAGVLAGRFAEMALRLAERHPEHRDRLLTVAESCRRVPSRPPETFQQTLQFAFFMHEIIEMEGEMVRSMGHFDRVFYPYYRLDIERGILTPGRAKELLKYFWYKWYARTRGVHNGKNFLFGGQDRDGNPVENELTYLALEAYDDLDIPDPKLSVRFADGTSDLLYRRCAEIIRNGRNSFVLLSDRPAYESLKDAGKTDADARCWLPIGCYEPAVDGKEAGCTMNIIVSIPKAVELALNNGTDPHTGLRMGPPTGPADSFADFPAFYRAFEIQLGGILENAVRCTGEYEREWPRINPSPVIAGTIEGCLETGLDVGEGGPVYNSVGCVGLGLASACDSLTAVERAVFGEGRVSLAELNGILSENFEGSEPLRQYLLNRIPKWGNGDPASDSMGARIARFFADSTAALTNGRGGRVQPALFSLRHCVEFGAAAGALPDGRRAAMPFSAGVGSVTGMDTEGVTALINSVTKVDYTKLPNGSVLDVTIHPSAVAGEAGLDAFVHLIKGYFDSGGFGIQFNVIDSETLREAQVHPEEYATLQVRVTGWSAYFVTLPRSEQDEYISRIAHRL